MKRHKRWLAVLAAAAITLSISSGLAAPETEPFADFRIDAADMDILDRTITVDLYRRQDGAFQAADHVEYACRVNRVTEDASFYIQPSKDGVWASVDYLTDLNGDGSYELLDGGEDPVWDVLDLRGGLAPPSEGRDAPALANAQTYILSGETLADRFRQAVQSRSTGSSLSLDMGQEPVSRQEYPLCMVKLHHTDPAGGEHFTQTYYLELYGTVLVPPDVSPDDWYYEAVKFVLAQGYFSGTGDGRFAPSDPLTRAQLAQVLWTMGGSLNAKMPQFSDVSPTDWFYQPVAWCQQEDLIVGYDSATFAPQDQLSREQMISILFRYARNSGAVLRITSDLSQFSDAADVSPWALDSMRWAVTNGLIPTSETALCPGDTVTRADLAATLYSYQMNLGSLY